MLKSLHVHYANKYPGARVHSGEDYLDVFSADGSHRVALRKNGAGQWVDRSEELGCQDRHDLAPIPKEARHLKLYADGRIAPAEEHDERKPQAQKLASEHGGRVPSIKELEEKAKAEKAAQK